jgi:hypothetical protein
MTAEEKEIMELSIKNAMLEGFQEFAKTMNESIDKGIEAHKQTCPMRKTSFADTIKDWKTIAAAILAIAWLLSSAMKPADLSRQQIEQVVQRMILDPNR